MSAIYIQNLLTLRRKEAGKRLSPSHARAESKLLFNLALKILSTTIGKTADDDYPQRYHGIINLPYNQAPFSTQTDLFERLAFKGQSLILPQTGKKGDEVWTSGQTEVNASLKFVWPHAVMRDNLIVPPRQRRYRRTREDVVYWGNAAVMVPDSNVPALVRLLRKQRTTVKAIIAAEGGVCVIFRTEAEDYPSWQHRCAILERHLGNAGIHVDKISLGTLVPTSDESRGVGATLYLA
ncbi:MAG: hypothetical protein ACO1TE_28935 [Prosthecobacter sp.]